MEEPSLSTIVISAAVGAISGIIANVLTVKHRLQAENEYAILMRIWSKAYLLKSRANSFRPALDTANPNDPNDPNEKQSRLNAFAQAKIEYDQEMYLNKPFYPDAIYACLKELRDNASFEAIDYSHQTASSDDRKYWADAKASAEKINGLVDRLCDAIRCRIHFAYRVRRRAMAVAKLRWPFWRTAPAAG